MLLDKMKIGILVAASIASTAFSIGGTWFVTKSDIKQNADRTTRLEVQASELNKEREAHAKQLIEIETTAKFMREDVAQIKRGVERLEDKLGTRP